MELTSEQKSEYYERLTKLTLQVKETKGEDSIQPATEIWNNHFKELKPGEDFESKEFFDRIERTLLKILND